MRFKDNIPANEHLTMQIASQIYGLRTAENALAFFADGKAAYITKRFDYAGDGSKILQDAFASLAEKTVYNHGKDDFIKFGKRIGVPAVKITQIIELFATEQAEVYELIENSFLNDKIKRMYAESYQERLHRFQRSDRKSK